jgi:putative transposase
MRADTLQPAMNAGKERAVLDFIGDYRNVAVQVSRVQWRLFFEAGKTNKNEPAKFLNSVCGAAPVQMASYQVQEQIDSWLSNRANEFVDCVSGSKLPDEIKKQLYTINRRKLWFSREPLDAFDPSVRKLARTIMRHCMDKHRRPDLSRISPRLDVRVATIEQPKTSVIAGLWAMLRLPNRGKIAIPLLTNKRFDQRGGDLCPVVQLCTDDANGVTVRLVQDMAKPFAAMTAAYVPKIETIGIDFGLATLLATSEGTLHGVGLIADLRRLDKQIAGIAKHRQRSGGKPNDSARYRKLVKRVRGMLRTRINAALNRIVALHGPASIEVERLDFRSPDLSRRMNRLVTNCGRSVFRAKLADMKEKFGITATEVPSPYTSQECCSCHYVDTKNRKSQSKFLCRFCGRKMHADVNGARTVTQRRSLGLGSQWLGKAAILGALVSQHTKRFLRPLGTAADPRMDNPYFRVWARGARMLQTQGLEPCVQKQ